jgi:multidrug resistance efflux pump
MRNHRTTMIGIAGVCCAAVIASAILIPRQLLGQAASSSFVAPGQVEGATAIMSIGTAASGTVRAVLVHQGGRVRAGEPLVTIDCEPIEAEIQARSARLCATQAAFDRARNGPRPYEIAVGEAIVGYSQARSEEAQKTLERTQAMREGFTVTTAHVLEVQRDARIAKAQLAEAQAKLALLRAGTREEDIREAEARRDAAAAELETARARLAQCLVRAPIDGVVLDVLANPGRFVSLAVPETLLRMVQDNALRVRADVGLRDLARLCQPQSATVTADAFPNTSIHAQVAAISPAITRRTNAAAGADPRSTEFVTVLLDVQAGQTLPIGTPVTVHFNPCASKS